MGPRHTPPSSARRTRLRSARVRAVVSTRRLTMLLMALAVAAALAACDGGIQSMGFDTGSGCDITNATSTFSTDDRVHYRAYFEPDLQAGDDITVTVSHDGERHRSLSSVLTLEEPTNCIHADFGQLDPGKYVVSVSSRIGTSMPPISGDFEVTGERLDRAPVGEVWFGSSYDLETFEIEGRTDSVQLGAPLALVTQLETSIAPEDLMLRLSRGGAVVQHDAADVEGTHESRLYGFAGTAPRRLGRGPSTSRIAAEMCWLQARSR